jgi:hypothetical protein
MRRRVTERWEPPPQHKQVGGAGELHLPHMDINATDELIDKDLNGNHKHYATFKIKISG